MSNHVHTKWNGLIWCDLQRSMETEDLELWRFNMIQPGSTCVLYESCESTHDLRNLRPSPWDILGPAFWIFLRCSTNASCSSGSTEVLEDSRIDMMVYMMFHTCWYWYIYICTDARWSYWWSIVQVDLIELIVKVLIQFSSNTFCALNEEALRWSFSFKIAQCTSFGVWCILAMYVERVEMSPYKENVILTLTSE